MTGWVNVVNLEDNGNVGEVARYMNKLEKNAGGSITSVNAEDFFTEATSGYVPTVISVSARDNGGTLQAVTMVSGAANGCTITARSDYITVVEDVYGFENPGFELGITGWVDNIINLSPGDGYTTAVVTDGSSEGGDNHHGWQNGHASLEMALNNTNFWDGGWSMLGMDNDLTNIVPGEEYVIAATVKVTDFVTTDSGYGWTPPAVLIKAETQSTALICEAGGIVTLASIEGQGDNGWVRLRGTGVAPGDAGVADKLYVAVVGTGNIVTANVKFEDISFGKLPPLPPSAVEEWWMH
jgi:hypothetical protein